jgi:hypothetical protein
MIIFQKNKIFYKYSVLIPRKNGKEYVVYNTDQVKILGPVKKRWWKFY